ncbi:MAG: hypothetical protein CM15mP83_9370 [Flavobacteriaceae bacterium]|nr:MAG: hypothetical protein CM15mP83_9370 [Flavobacteriaceae bacterium]
MGMSPCLKKKVVFVEASSVISMLMCKQYSIESIMLLYSICCRKSGHNQSQPNSCPIVPKQKCVGVCHEGHTVANRVVTTNDGDAL